MIDNDEIAEKITAVASQIETINSDMEASITELKTRMAAMEEKKDDKPNGDAPDGDKPDGDKPPKDKEGMGKHSKKGDDGDDDEKKKKMKEMEEKNASMAQDIKRLNAMASQPRIDALKHAYKGMVDEETLKTKTASWEKMTMEELNAAYETIKPFIRIEQASAQAQAGWQMPPTGYGQDNDDLITLEASAEDILKVANSEVIA